ncbi:NAD(P)-binding protein [Streptomyces sp. b94]|uniref:GMC oxidoreductase n=1 Tax=Streptomyces sp. b94 TaxID=1827634 RepID=UPI001B3913E5|nr:GMC oxidoreductase [Streptomyces sp. b94]MBQ1095490.1 NAD(P)-binding protein [Streptomyces sp. b94]
MLDTSKGAKVENAPEPGEGPHRYETQWTEGRDENHSVVIVGAGLAGSIAAYRLAEAGIACTVLERGRRWPITVSGDTFPHFPSCDKRLVWRDGVVGDGLLPRAPWLPRMARSTLWSRSTGLLDVAWHRNLTTVCGAGVGGGTLVYGGMLPQPGAEQFGAVFPDIPYEEMSAKYYPTARRRLRAQPFPDDLLPSRRYRSNRIWKTLIERSGMQAERVESSFDFNVIRAELKGEAPPSATVGQYLFTGCNSGAKMSVDRTYLAQAEATGRATVRPLHNVTHIAHHAGKFRLTIEQLHPDGTVLNVRVISCDRLIMAAGGVHTPRLLVTARDTGALPDLNEHVGAGWGTNGDQAPLIKTLVTRTGAPQGGPPAFLARGEGGSIMLSHGGYPLPFESGLMQCTGLGVPDAYGQWTYEADTRNAQLHWPSHGDRSVQRQVSALMRRITRQTRYGAVFVDPFKRRPLVLHPLGGTVIGKATDPYGRIHGYQGLYCLDSALMPGSTAAVNPSLTIAAVAERCLDHIITDFTE